MPSIISMMERSRLDTYVNPTMNVIIFTLIHTKKVFVTCLMLAQFLVL
nr:ankyrin-like protein [Vaccinia virus]